MAQTVVTGLGSLKGMQALHRTRFLIVILYLSGIVVAGFSPYFLSLASFKAPEAHWLIHIHAACFVGWLLLLFEQARRMYVRDYRGHLRLGALGIRYGFAMLALGLVVAFSVPVMRYQAGDRTLDQAAEFLLFTVGDMVLFGLLFFAAAKTRNRPALHKRFMLMAATALTFAASVRLMSPFQIPGLFLAFWLSPILLMMLLDTIKSSKHHMVYGAGIVLMLLLYARVFVAGSELWLPTGRAIIQLLAF
ncbi:hypothetical protein [Kordiimonas lacus]|uniref:Uncharacterized protein n=1 Tax=Kordiimonas lacus TaxID=637679 RepID=A0A1G7BCV1_9PROT|nr:hypothetical protein [Kordiimonas lacus]SDE24630.1 hypothetical protein SAMN04488071_2453 [Kordiimonas lacus]